MRVLLINSNLKDDILAAPPIGLSYIAGATEAAGHEVKVLDLCFKRRIATRLRYSIKEFCPDVVGISVRNIDNVNLLSPLSYLSKVRTIIEKIRNSTTSPIIIGGSGASLCPAGVMEQLKADYIIVSDGEYSFVNLLNTLENEKSPENIPGLGMYLNGKFRLNPPVFKDFKTGRADMGKWVDMRPYGKMGSSYLIQTKRGCTQRCIYCTYNQVLEGNRLRLRSPEDIVDEIDEALHRYNPESIEFVDSVFNIPIDHCTEILEEILKRSLKVNYTAMGVNPSNLDNRFLELMWRAGFRSFMMSPESASETMIQNYRKGFSADDLVRSADAIRKTRFTVLWYFLIGGPGEINSTLEETLDFTSKYLNLDTRPPYNMANFFLGVRLYPGTDLWEIALDEGIINKKSDPLRQLWYVSKNLDLNFAVEQMIEAAAKNPKIILGFDERYLPISRIVPFIGKLAGLPKPYWRHIWGLNRILIRTGLRFVGLRKDIPSSIREMLKRQMKTDSL